MTVRIHNRGSPGKILQRLFAGRRLETAGVPHFTFEQAQKVIAAHQARGWKAWYDEPEDQFVSTSATTETMSRMHSQHNTSKEESSISSGPGAGYGKKNFRKLFDSGLS